MNKEVALNDFLKGLRIALSNASAYSKDHPYFIKSIENFRHTVDTLFTFLSPIKINIAPDSLFLDGKQWQKQTLYIELANLFHLRKIKSIEFRDGLTTEELIDFLSSVALPVREILKAGGFARILRGKDNPHLSIEELDYSELLRQEGEETKDVWAYLFKEAVEKRDFRKINEYADNFEKIMKKFKVKDFSENENLREDLYNFLSYLKVTQKEKFCRCARETFNSLLKHKEALSDERLDKLKSLFKDLNKDEFACMFWDGVMQDESFDILNLNLFSQLTAGERQNEIASSLLERAPSRESLRSNPSATKRIQNILSSSGGELVSEVYRNILTSLFKDISLEKGMSFDRDLLYTSYRYALLNLLSQEKNKKRLNMILEKLSGEWKVIEREKDPKFIKYLSQTLRQRIKEEPNLASLFDELQRRISGFLESVIWEKETDADLIELADNLEKSSQNADFYISRIFAEGKVNAIGIKLFFRFFPESLASFNKNLEKKKTDMEFLSKIVGALKEIDSALSIEILKNIYFFASEVIKIEVLEAMQQLSSFDRQFIFSILERGDLTLKKEALALLSRDARLRREAIDMLLTIESPWGLKNKILLENMTLVEELGLREAGGYLDSLSRRKFFWNRNIRKKARQILEKWYARKD